MSGASKTPQSASGKGILQSLPLFSGVETRSQFLTIAAPKGTIVAPTIKKRRLDSAPTEKAEHWVEFISRVSEKISPEMATEAKRYEIQGIAWKGSSSQPRGCFSS